jgi:hypothetical protein
MIEMRFLVTEEDYLLQYRLRLDISADPDTGLAQIPNGAEQSEDGQYWTEWKTVPEVNG